MTAREWLNALMVLLGHQHSNRCFDGNDHKQMLRFALMVISNYHKQKGESTFAAAGMLAIGIVTVIVTDGCRS